MQNPFLVGYLPAHICNQSPAQQCRGFWSTRVKRIALEAVICCIQCDFTIHLIAAPPNGYECQLLGGGLASPPPLFNWSSCTQSTAYGPLSDSRYSFGARAVGKWYRPSSAWLPMYGDTWSSQSLKCWKHSGQSTSSVIRIVYLYLLCRYDRYKSSMNIDNLTCLSMRETQLAAYAMQWTANSMQVACNSFELFFKVSKNADFLWPSLAHIKYWVGEHNQREMQYCVQASKQLTSGCLQ